MLLLYGNWGYSSFKYCARGFTRGTRTCLRHWYKARPHVQKKSFVEYRRAVHCSTSAESIEAPTTAESFPNSPPKLVLYNTMDQMKSALRPLNDGKVSMYVCGVTVYDLSHIGHARAYVVFDVLYRLLLQLGYEVTYVRNFTDIDDKIIARANKNGEDTGSLCERFIKEFHIDMELLGCKPPSKEPRATQYVPQMVSMIDRIVANGHAYVMDDGDVYFDTASLEEYGRLSRRKEDDNRAGERVVVDGRKRNPADFVLWKSSKPGEPTWSSPWGEGRPGWHIECSCMIKEIIGPVVDIHGGGCDLVFPHHENELAQSQAAASPCDKEVMTNGIDFVRHWVHNGFVKIDNEKMSKSLGNFFTIRDVLHHHHPLALRWMLLGTHYRQQLNYSQESLQIAGQNIFYVYQTLLDIDEALEEAGVENPAKRDDSEESSAFGEVLAALRDDMNSSIALASVFGCLKTLNDTIHTKKLSEGMGEVNELLCWFTQGKKRPDRIEFLTNGVVNVRDSLSLLGFDTSNPGQVLSDIRRLTLTRANMTEDEVQAVIDKRNVARKAKDYSKADEYRSMLLDKGILMCDTPQGTIWRPGSP